MWIFFSSVWSTTVVPGKDLTRSLTKASCGLHVCFHLDEVKEEGVSALPFPKEDLVGRERGREGGKQAKVLLFTLFFLKA